MFVLPPRLQFAALCWRRAAREGTCEILLITSRGTGRWVVPKGWPMKGAEAAAIAAMEAHEEAGVRGRVEQAPLGTFTYAKEMRGGLKVGCTVQVHALEVEGLDEDFRERGQRRLAWFSPAEAAERVDEPGLKAMLGGFRR
ncbi:NUDIX hydrolase [Pararhizobium mangrovi]|uniref:NUDIX hydrolase n=1 Tax=Pararhizobium mangrovi TaxID=2590452 RepID=A0A506U6B4_9HYPH|nr:NUDIX hydrolase [Pararhizobium mangrovi]